MGTTIINPMSTRISTISQPTINYQSENESNYLKSHNEGYTFQVNSIDSSKKVVV